MEVELLEGGHQVSGALNPGREGAVVGKRDHDRLPSGRHGANIATRCAAVRECSTRLTVA